MLTELREANQEDSCMLTEKEMPFYREQLELAKVLVNFANVAHDCEGVNEGAEVCTSRRDDTVGAQGVEMEEKRAAFEHKRSTKEFKC